MSDVNGVSIKFVYGVRVCLHLVFLGFKVDGKPLMCLDWFNKMFHIQAQQENHWT